MFHFVGIGGSGMSGLAQALLDRGERVSGSDRRFDREPGAPVFAKLRGLGAALFPQDGSGVAEQTRAVVLSTAVEDSIPDVRRARQLGRPILHRSEVLAEVFNSERGIAVTGTSGKTTTAALCAFLLDAAGLRPGFVVGGEIPNFEDEKRLAGARGARGQWFVIEADESDGTVVRYAPEIGVITSLGRDHFEPEKIRELFAGFAAQTRRILLVRHDVGDLPGSASSAGRRTFGIDGGEFCPKEVRPEPWTSSFRLEGRSFRLNLPGLHNVENATAALLAAAEAGAPWAAMAEALPAFLGVRRRFEKIGEARGVTVVDDFAHSPVKIRAVLAAAKRIAPRILAVFQPHGFGPTRFHRTGYVEAFAESLRPDDRLFLPEIYYAGGTADRALSSSDLVSDLAALARPATFFEDRAAIPPALAREARPSDLVLSLGARDETLPAFAHEILAALSAP